MIVRGDKPITLPSLAVLGLVGLALLTLLQFGLRGTVVMALEPASTHLHLPSPKNDTGKTHNHLEHCALCILQLWIPSLVPDPGPASRMMTRLPLWLGECRAREEFLRGVVARGPPVAVLRSQTLGLFVSWFQLFLKFDGEKS